MHLFILYCYIVDIQIVPVSNVIIWHLHTLWNDHHDKYSNHLSPYEFIIISLTIFLVMYITFLWLIYFITRGLFLIPFTCLTFPTQPPLLATIHLFSVSLNLFSHCFVCFSKFHIWVKSHDIWLWLISLSIIPTRSIQVTTNGKISFLFFLNGWVICHGVWVCRGICVWVCVYVYMYITSLRISVWFCTFS